jgi:hypothetical protein
MYSKDVGDFDVRIDNEQNEREYVEHQEFSWNNLYGRRAPLHSQTTAYEHSFQTDLHDTKRDVGYTEIPIKQQEDTIEEQRQEIITFRLPQKSPETTVEETYETSITTERQQNNQQFEETYETSITTERQQNNQQFEEIRSQMKHEDVDATIIKSETAEWIRSLGSSAMKSSIDTTKQEETRSRSPEELVEESYEVVSTLAKPRDSGYLITSTSPRSTTTLTSSTTQRYVDTATGKPPTSEDESSYCEEWTVTEAKRKQDGQTVKTIIDR